MKGFFLLAFSVRGEGSSKVVMLLSLTLQIPGIGPLLWSFAAPPVSGPGTPRSVSSVNIPQKDC